MADISKIRKKGVDYDIKDATARSATAVSAEYNEDTKTVCFKNAFGEELFNLDLSGLGGGSAAVYGNLVLSAEELTITEGQNGTFTVALDKAPTANQPVYLAVSDGSRLSVEPAVLTFTPENWETPQTITVTSLEDDDEEDNAIIVTLTSTSVDARQVAVAIRDNDVQMEIVTDGLVLNMDYTGHVGDESDTITDLASGLTFNNFSQFEKQETGITSPSTTYKYMGVVDDDAKTAFLAKVKATGGFTLESFGTRLLPCFFLPNYKVVLDSGNAGGWKHTDTVPVCAKSQVTRILQDDTTDQTHIGGEKWLYTLGEFTQPMNSNFINKLFPYIEEFKHVVMTFSADGHVDCFVNGVKGDSPVSVENYKAWDFDTMFGGQWSLLNNSSTSGVTTALRIYNRVLTAEEVQQNMKANAKMLGLETF